METPKAKSVSTGKIVSIVVIAALVAVVTFLVIQNLSLKGEVEEGIQTAEDLTAEIDAVEKQVQEYESMLKDKDLDIETKERMLSERDSMIQDKDSKIADLLRRNRISQQEAEKLRGRVEVLEHYVAKYESQIQDLKVQLAIKTGEVDSLKLVVGSTQDSLRKTTDVAIRQDIKLKAASRLSAHTFKFSRYKQSGTPVEETKFLPSQLDRLKICIDIAENAAKDAGEKVVYFVIKDADGKLVRDEAKSGFFKFEGHDAPYSAMTRMNWEKVAVKVCLDFAQPSGYKYPEGKCTVQAYCDGYEIGSSSFLVN